LLQGCDAQPALELAWPFARKTQARDPERPMSLRPGRPVARMPPGLGLASPRARSASVSRLGEGTRGLHIRATETGCSSAGTEAKVGFRFGLRSGHVCSSFSPLLMSVVGCRSCDEHAGAPIGRRTQSGSRSCCRSEASWGAGGVCGTAAGADAGCPSREWRDGESERRVFARVLAGRDDGLSLAGVLLTPCK
jgi:hypothetical protein